MIRWPNVFGADEWAGAEHHDVIGTDKERPASVLLEWLLLDVTVKPNLSLASVGMVAVCLRLIFC